jgi:hypothetical protein
MAASFDVSVIAQLTGLGKQLDFAEKFSTATPTLSSYNYDSIGTDAEALDISDISTVEFIVIKNTDDPNYVEIDCNYSSSFSADIQIDAGQTAIFKPSGVVQAKANTAAVIVEYIVIGTA